ncbi:hypothetical protein SELMODRAFT_428400 [Selaginella moellendorffii]|uniref:Bulb-type lectin domain-containing protein n=1 Tax=Selaginella moellendorffii TaxID=88036 RepID=D8T2P5_SELML|nr:hypothetical protein SELMODRAFT_428400 [Selaginella moellendorffii]
MCWEFSDQHNAITPADVNMILDAVIDNLIMFGDDTYYESGRAYVDQITVTNNVVIDIVILAYHTDPNLDFCHVNPASSMLAVSEMFGVQYRIAPNQQMETLHSQTKKAIEDDCSLSLNEAGRRQVWTNGVCGRGVDCYLTVELNGNMVVKETPSQAVIWSLDKFCDGPCYAFVTMQRDRNVVLYHVFKSSPEEGYQLLAVAVGAPAFMEKEHSA